VTSAPTDRIINGIIGRIERDDSRYYIDPADPSLVYDSVTTILSATNSKSWLQNWAAKLAAEFAVDHHHLVGITKNEASREAAIDLIKGEARRKRELKADIGTHQHDILEALILDAPIPSCPEHLVDLEIDGESVDQDAIADGLLNFISDFGPTFEMAEATVANRQYMYAGTLDLVAWFPTIRIPDNLAKGARLCLDLKTGANVDATARPQVVGYKRSDHVWVDEMGNKAPMPTVDLCGVVHLRREYRRGYKLLIVPPADEEFYFEQFLHCLEAFRDQDAVKAKRLTPFYPPLADGSQPLPLLEDIEGEGFGRCRRHLAGAGLDDLGDLAALTVAEVRSIKGIGPAAVTACTEVLRQYGLAFKAEVA
jgi:hypothetical protein